MSIAAYNRGSRAISNQIFPSDLRYSPAKVRTADPLPEGRLRSGFLPENFLAGTAVFLEYENGWYLVRTRWQNLARRRRLAVAAKLFEDVQMYGSAVIPWVR
jgi:hypothetical protein